MIAIDPAATVGAVSLRVNDIDAEAEFYGRAIGLEQIAAPGRDGVALSGPGSRSPLVHLVEDAGAPPRRAGTTGLFHLAILLPDRPELARALHRVSGAGVRLTGASDHLVSEALYLNDPEGNGIEIYRDRPRDEWEMRDGEIAMATLPLDIQNLSGELGSDKSVPPKVAEETTMGHVHLNIANVEQAEAFYSGVLGFDVMVRGYPGALFVAAGGYHHHLGLNTWTGEGAPPPPPGTRGLERFTIEVPTDAEVDRLEGELEAAGISHSRTDTGMETTDPSGNRVEIVRAA